MAIEQFIDNEVKANDVVLFMKGTPQFPMCGFSGQVVQILDYLGVAYKGLNVLENDELRSGIKSYSNWPTIPQLYVKGEFVGGCDIIREMFQAGELQSLLKDKGVAVKESAASLLTVRPSVLRRYRQRVPQDAAMERRHSRQCDDVVVAIPRRPARRHGDVAISASNIRPPDAAPSSPGRARRRSPECARASRSSWSGRPRCSPARRARRARSPRAPAPAASTFP